MNRAVDPQDYAYFKVVDAAVLGETGVRAVEIQTDYVRDGEGMRASVRRARLSGMPADQFARTVAADMNLAPAASFASREEAALTNARRAALAGYRIENPEWHLGVNGTDGAIYRAGDDGQVVKLGLVRSGSGEIGFGIAVAEDATVVEWDGEGVRGVVVAPPNAEFRQVAAAADIVDAVDGYNRVYEETHSASLGM